MLNRYFLIQFIKLIKKGCKPENPILSQHTAGKRVYVSNLICGCQPGGNTKLRAKMKILDQTSYPIGTKQWQLKF